MTEESLPLINSKNQHVAAQSFWAANSRKLGLLLLLLLSGCLGLGIKFWLETKETSVSLDQMIGSHEVSPMTTSSPTRSQTVILAVIVQQPAALRGINLHTGMVIGFVHCIWSRRNCSRVCRKHACKHQTQTI